VLALSCGYACTVNQQIAEGQRREYQCTRDEQSPSSEQIGKRAGRQLEEHSSKQGTTSGLDMIGHWLSTASNDWQVFHDFGSSARAAPTTECWMNKG
jgi:hypothetical protein